MNAVRINISAFVDDGCPGWVECELIDADGVIHKFVEKAPAVSVEDLRQESTFPREGAFDCAVISNWTNEHGVKLSKIDTSKPWGIESKAGITEFVVPSSSIQSTE